jgi:phytoene dehydrogenase-like protein
MGGSGQVVGGLDRLRNALSSAAVTAGAEVSCGLEVTDAKHRRGRMLGLRLADGTEIEARAVISTLDIKRTFLSLFAWSGLPAETAKSVAAFRMAGSTARLLLALDKLPDPADRTAQDFFAQPIHLGFGDGDLSRAYGAWRGGAIAQTLPITLRFVSAVDPRLAPIGMACATATVGCVPHRLFDGAWTHDKREGLKQHVFAAIEQVLPGFQQRVLACELLVPGDIEEQLGVTDGDLWGGEIAADQMLSYRPFAQCGTRAPRSPFAGLYLAGGSTPAGVLGTCVSGVIAADAVIADLRSGALR